MITDTTRLMSRDHAINAAMKLFNDAELCEELARGYGTVEKRYTDRWRRHVATVKMWIDDDENLCRELTIGKKIEELLVTKTKHTEKNDKQCMPFVLNSWTVTKNPGF